MSLLYLPLEAIDEKALQSLIDAKVPEARDIDYKRESYGNSDNEHAEWLADISSFANTAGGDIVIGMDEKAGAPTGFKPLAIDLDQEILRLEQLARSNLQPRLPHLSFRRVPIASGGEVLVVRTPRSYNPPHRIVRNGKGQNRFWARSSAGKYEPNVDELRAMFNLAPQLSDRIRDFRADRVAKIAAGATPVTLMDAACLVLHVVPLSSLDPGRSPISLVDADKNPHPFAPMGSRHAINWWVNFDGILIPSNTDRNAGSHRAYSQLYRDGRVEVVASSIAPRAPEPGAPSRLTSHYIEGLVLVSLVRSLKGLNALGVEPPFAALVSLIGVKGLQIHVGSRSQWFDDDDTAILTQDQYHFSEVILDYVPASIQDCGVMVKPFIEQLAQTAGRPTSSSFGPQGEYIHVFQ